MAIVVIPEANAYESVLARSGIDNFDHIVTRAVQNRLHRLRDPHILSKKQSGGHSLLSGQGIHLEQDTQQTVYLPYKLTCETRPLLTTLFVKELHSQDITSCDNL